MPQGIVITKWTHDKGMIVDTKYPETIEVDLDDMMRVFYAHVVGAGSGGDVLVRLEKAHSNVSSHFTGMDAKVPYLVNLMLEIAQQEICLKIQHLYLKLNNILNWVELFGLMLNGGMVVQEVEDVPIEAI